MPACLEATSGQATTRVPLSEALPEVREDWDPCIERLLQELEPLGHAHVELDGSPQVCVHHEPDQGGLRQEILLAGGTIAFRYRHARLRIPQGACRECAQATEHALLHHAGVDAAHLLPQTNEILVEHAPRADAESLQRLVTSRLGSQPEPPAFTLRSGAGPLPMAGLGNATPARGKLPAVHDHDEHDGHDHGHHDHGPGEGNDQSGHDHGAELHDMARTNRRRLLIALVLGTSVLLAEIFVGLLANSLALLADAAHAVTDQAAVALALVAVTWGMRAATRGKTFGYRRGEVVAAFVNSLALWAVSAYFIFEALQRIGDPPVVEGRLVIVMGAITLAANLAAAKVLHGGSGHSINMRAAFLHVLSDALGSAAALVAGLLVEYYGWHIADPILTLFIAALILVFTLKLTRQSLHILMEGAPKHIDPEDVERTLRALPDVKDVHDLHVWSITHGSESLTAHVVLRAPPKDDKAMHDVHELLESKFKLRHLTIQVESPDCPCATRHCGPA